MLEAVAVPPPSPGAASQTGERSETSSQTETPNTGAGATSVADGITASTPALQPAETSHASATNALPPALAEWFEREQELLGRIVSRRRPRHVHPRRPSR